MQKNAKRGFSYLQLLKGVLKNYGWIIHFFKDGERTTKYTESWRNNNSLTFNFLFKLKLFIKQQKKFFFEYEGNTLFCMF